MGTPRHSAPRRSAKISSVAASGDVSPSWTASITRTAEAKKSWNASMGGQYEPTRGWYISRISCSREALAWKRLCVAEMWSVLKLTEAYQTRTHAFHRSKFLHAVYEPLTRSSMRSSER